MSGCQWKKGELCCVKPAIWNMSPSSDIHRIFTSTCPRNTTGTSFEPLKAKDKGNDIIIIMLVEMSSPRKHLKQIYYFHLMYIFFCAVTVIFSCATNIRGRPWPHFLCWWCSHTSYCWGKSTWCMKSILKSVLSDMEEETVNN